MKAAIIEREWAGQTAAIFASGPSMTFEIAEAVRGRCRVIAINNQSFDCAPWADVFWASDHKWWVEYIGRVKSLPARKLMVRRGAFHRDVEFLEYSAKVYDDRKSFIATGGNSGYAAICLAAKLGASRILLFGFDMQKVAGRTRRHDYPKHLNSSPRFVHWLPKFAPLAKELKARRVDVVNCTSNSALRAFRFGHLEDELKEVRCA